jgi:hypothetical protein
MRAPKISTLTALLLAAGVVAPAPLAAQGWWWPWSQQQQAPPVPREPIYRQPPGDAGPPAEQPGAQPAPAPGKGAGPQGGPPGAYGQRGANNICLQLEQRLVGETQLTGQGRDLLPKLESDMRQLERTLALAQAQLNRADCWDQFLFSRTLRRTPRCIQLNSDVETTRQRLADLDAQRRQIMGRGERSYQDDIIRELARNGCGTQYVQEARRRDAAHNPFSSLFGDEEDDGPRGPANQFGNLPFATYRTLCVRLCDGYYFPVSFSTLPNHFGRDAEQCQAQCAAPAELYYHQNPGGAVEQMVSAATQQPYTNLKSAWRYRKEFVQGCSCKASEYVPDKTEKGAERKAEAPVQPVQPPSVTARLAPHQ